MNADGGTPDFGDGLRHIRTVVNFLQPLDEKNAMDTIMPLLHPEVKILGAPGIGPARGYESRADFARYFADVQEQGVWIRTDAHRIEVMPSGAILVSATLRITGRAGTDTTPAWFVFKFSLESIILIETHLDEKIAQESAAL